MGSDAALPRSWGGPRVASQLKTNNLIDTEKRLVARNHQLSVSAFTLAFPHHHKMATVAPAITFIFKEERREKM